MDARLGREGFKWRPKIIDTLFAPKNHEQGQQLSLNNDVGHSLAMSTQHKWLEGPFSPNRQPVGLTVFAKTEVFNPER